MASQDLKYLDLEEMRHVQRHVRPRDPTPDTRGLSTHIQQHGDRRRGVQDDQRPSAEIARIIRVSQAPDRCVRRFIQLDRLVLRDALHQLPKGRFLGHLLYLRKQIIRQRHPCPGCPNFQLAVQIVGYVSDLDHLRHVGESITCSKHVNSEPPLG